jgi:signal transduction histidine kinase
MVVTLIPRRIFSINLQLLMTPTTIIAGIGVVVIISILKDGLIVGLSGVILVLMFNFGFFRLRFIFSLLSGIIICLSYDIAVITRGLPSSLILANNFFLISSLISGASVTYLLERLFRSQFLAEKELTNEREALARQHQVDNRYLDWLRRLASFLRHEVRQPVAQINSNIELIQLLHGRDERIKSYISGASLAVHQVWNLIERASRATDAEAFVRKAMPRVIDLETLITDVVVSYRQTCSGVYIHLEAKDNVLVRADPTLIKEGVENLLSNAVSFAKGDSTIHIVLEVDRTQAIIRVRNAGELLKGNTEMYFMPFVSSRSGPSSEHQGLGLYLVRLIAEQHGGAAAIKNLEDGSGVEASISLPVALYSSSTQR